MSRSLALSAGSRRGSASPAVLRRGGVRLACLAGLAAAELLILSLAYQHGFDFTCRAAAPDWFCAAAGRAVPRALGVLAALAIFAMARRAALADLLARSGPLGFALALNLVGLILAFAPWPLLSDASSSVHVSLAAGAWIAGALGLGAGLALALAPAAAWGRLVARHGGTLALLMLAGLALPELATLLFPLWRVEAVTDVTFAAVRETLLLLGYAVEAVPAEKAIGTPEFRVLVGPQCSGVEGFVLITVFLTLYLGLFRRELRFPQALLLYPVGLALSWAFNVARITALVALGLEGHPELAVGGFHSHAGWLAFTTLSVLMILVSRAVPWITRASGARAPSRSAFFADPAVARLFPFIVFMLSALLASTFSETPAELYPWRALAMGGALALVWPAIRSLPWRLDPLAISAGLAIGALWLATAAPAPDAPSPVAGMAAGAAALWIATRLLGTIVFVPIIEELVFRGYLIDRIAPAYASAGRVWPMALAVGLGAVLFALLHDRWLVAGVAGVVFGALVWRSRNLTDAILSHAAANAVIAAWAVATGAWHVI